MAENRTAAWVNRITGYGDEAPDQLLANPRNYRIHPRHQQAALSGVLAEVGVVQNILVNQRSGRVIDGHLRVALAISQGQPSVPVTYVDLDDAEEAKILATFDPLAALAGTDQAQLVALLEEVETNNAGLADLLARLAVSTNDAEPPDSFPAYDENIATEHQCPKCGYEWSGKPS